MAVASRGRTEFTSKWKERDTSPDRKKVWTEPKSKSSERKVPVVYYLSRNGHLEHPHFMEVSLSSSEGLYLRDVINRLNFLRGNGMAGMYSWSSKRSYKNGFVWHDLSEDDFVYPAHGQEYVLKGSELLTAASSSSQDTTSAASSSSFEKSLDIPKSVQGNSDFPLCYRKKTPWCPLDLNEDKVYKTNSTAEDTAKAADASTQTDEKRQWRRAPIRDDENRADNPNPEEENPTTELERDEISPPPSSSSPDTLESLIKTDCRAGTVGGGAIDEPDRAVGVYPSGRVGASAVLMNLISCGSISVKDHGFSLVSHYRVTLPRGAETSDQAMKDVEGTVDHPSFPARRLEDKEYLSGSLIETKKNASDGAGEFPSLKRSSSYNADRRNSYSKLGLLEKEMDGVRAKCIPRRPPKSSTSRIAISRKEGSNSMVSRSAHGSKRINDESQK